MDTRILPVPPDIRSTRRHRRSLLTAKLGGQRPCLQRFRAIAAEPVLKRWQSQPHQSSGRRGVVSNERNSGLNQPDLPDVPTLELILIVLTRSGDGLPSQAVGRLDVTVNECHPRVPPQYVPVVLEALPGTWSAQRSQR